MEEACGGVGVFIDGFDAPALPDDFFGRHVHHIHKQGAHDVLIVVNLCRGEAPAVVLTPVTAMKARGAPIAVAEASVLSSALILRSMTTSGLSDLLKPLAAISVSMALIKTSRFRSPMGKVSLSSLKAKVLKAAKLDCLSKSRLTLSVLQDEKPGSKATITGIFIIGCSKYFKVKTGLPSDRNQLNPRFNGKTKI